MANSAVTATTWIGTTTDATLGSNWTFGVPDAATIDVYVPGTVTTSLVGFGASRGRGTLTSPGSVNFANGDTVTIDAKTYTFVDPAAPSADGEVGVGADVEASLDNLFDAINLVAGGDYGGSMTIHPTVTALSNTATALVVAAKDGGTAGNSIVSTVGGGNTGDAAWGGGTLSGGAATGALMNNVYTDEAFVGDINSSGTEAAIAFNKLFHRGSGTAYIDVQSANRLIVDSTNTILATQVVLTGGLVSMEVVRGTATLNQSAVVDSAQRVVLTEATSIPSKLTITGTGTIGVLRKAGGYLIINGPTITDAVLDGGRTTLVSGVITALINTSNFALESTSTQPLIEHLRGPFDMTTTAAAKTVTTFWKYPTGELTYRETFDTIGSLKKIGEN